MKVKVKVGSDVILDTSKKQVSKVLPPDSIIQPPKTEEPAKVLPKVKDKPKDAIFNKVVKKEEIVDEVKPAFTIEVPETKLDKVVSEEQVINNEVAIEAATKYTEPVLDTPVTNVDEEGVVTTSTFHEVNGGILEFVEDDGTRYIDTGVCPEVNEETLKALEKGITTKIKILSITDTSKEETTESEETTVDNNELSNHIMETLKNLEEAVNAYEESEGFPIADLIGNNNLDNLSELIDYTKTEVNTYEDSGAKSYTDEALDEPDAEPTLDEEIASWTDKDTGIIASLEECGFINTNEEQVDEKVSEIEESTEQKVFDKYDLDIDQMAKELDEMERELEEDYEEYNQYLSNRDREELRKSKKQQNKSNNDFSGF